jgi:hypothetical protein
MNPSGHGLMFLRLGAVAMVLTACATGPTSPDSIGSTPEAPASLAASSPGKLVELLELETAAQVFLAAMCPTEMELHNVENVAIAAGGWTEASPSKVRRAASQAVTAVGQSAELLVQETRWPPELERDMRATTDELLALASPLQGLSEARSGAEMERYWTRIEKASRVAEQRLRLSLGLGLARSADDGCPPAPKVSRPKPESASPPSPQSGQTPRPATGPMPILTGPMIESTSDAICYLDPYAMPPLVGTNSDPWATRLIQIFAVMNGFNPGPIDGQYGPNTVAAVIQLQRLVGVVPDGQVGPITWGALSRYHCPR